MTERRRVSPRWEAKETVAGFASSPPNAVLLEFTRALVEKLGALDVLDLGCGALRNALPLSELGCRVTGVDLSEPMLDAARERLRSVDNPQVTLVRSGMAPLPFTDRAFDLVIAHGIWNLARSGEEFRSAVAEAARVIRPGGHLFLFTFSRNTMPPDAPPVAGEAFVFTQFNGEPQCFLTEREIVDELGRAGFVKDPPGPLTEYNRGPTPRTVVAGPPVLFEGTFIRTP